MSYWDEQYEQALAEESGGGGGIICKAVVQTGFKVYAGGMPQEDTFFVAEAGDKPARKAALAEATKLAASQGARRPQFGIQIRVDKDNAYRRSQGVWEAATYQTDRFFVTDGWTDAAEKVVKPSLDEHGIRPGNEFWCRISFQEDPYKVSLGEAGMTDEDQNGNPRFPLVAYVADVFENEEAAKAAMSGEDAEAASRPPIPNGWDFDNGDSWGSVVAGLKETGAQAAVVAKLKALSEKDRQAQIGDASVEDMVAWWDAV